MRISEISDEPTTMKYASVHDAVDTARRMQSRRGVSLAILDCRKALLDAGWVHPNINTLMGRLLLGAAQRLHGTAQDDLRPRECLIGMATMYGKATAYKYHWYMAPEVWEQVQPPEGAIATKPSLRGEVIVKADKGRYNRYAFSQRYATWVHVGIAMRRTDIDGVRYWEHGTTEADCASACQAKIAAAREWRSKGDPPSVPYARRFAMRILTMCPGVTVGYDDIRKTGACHAGIAAWCAHHGVDLEGRVPLKTVYADAPEWAAKVAMRIAADRISRRDKA